MIKKFLAFLLLVTFSFSFTDGIFANNNQNNSEIIFTSENQKVIIYENGVEIKGKYYTKEEFEELLKTAKKLNIQPRYAFALPWVTSGSYYIAGIGTVVITKAGEVIVAGGSILAGTWLATKIREFFSSTKSVEEEYNDAKRECRPSNNHKTTNDERNNNGKEGDKFSTLDFYENGKLKKRRYFGGDGIADFDIDFFHQDSKKSHRFPHCHNWINGKRSSNWFDCCK